MSEELPITIVVAVTQRGGVTDKFPRDGIIGKGNALPWSHIPEDLRYFRAITMGGAIIMGRLTFESIGKPLPKRLNIVVSRTCNHIDGCEVVPSPEAALDVARKSGKNIYVIGGEQIYRQLLPKATVIRMTELNGVNVKSGDAYFPWVNTKEWRMVRTRPMRENNGRFITYHRQFFPQKGDDKLV